MLGIPLALCCLLPAILGLPLEDQYEIPEAYKALTPHDLAVKAGYQAESYEVVTEDGYILGLERITGSEKSPPAAGKPVVLLIHGLLDCSPSWVFPGPEKGFALMLSDWGYDVWMGNVRGNRYSRKHVNLTVSNPDYWLFSWHEMGVYDIPAMIDYALKISKQEKLFLVSHSQGGSAFFVMATERPEYQEKIIASFALAPATFMNNSKNPLLNILAPHSSDIKFMLDLIGMSEFKPSKKLIQTLGKIVCDDQSFLQPVCKNIVFLIGGFNDKDMNLTLLSTVVQYDPAGASTRQFVHYAQLMTSGKFRKYDHGLIGNMKKYGQIHPPDYDLAKVKLPVYIYYGSNDILVAPEDTRKLYEKLPNAQKFLVPYEYFTHLDFLWGKHVDIWVYNQVLSLMERYKK
ncbi:lipase 3-like [Ceratina calcarata]|uniref:Lipase n=1 Tax=Ceratina calcarata TaxID=156304 RepID=A0AAJ7JAF1_9HYME|nr:lipase 3-like [Ceratina calcarata]